MSELHVVVGCNGPVGIELVRQLRQAGHEVRGSCRSGRAQLAQGATIAGGDISSADDARRICDGAHVVYSCVGVDYTRWPELWPRPSYTLWHAADGSRWTGEEFALEFRAGHSQRLVKKRSVRPDSRLVGARPAPPASGRGVLPPCRQPELDRRSR